ncbi:MAG: hypothetical protein JWQ25_2441 [Daejeonella sp.]|nr:hypothetical protein [Daejeonella sp.]
MRSYVLCIANAFLFCAVAFKLFQIHYIGSIRPLKTSELLEPYLIDVDIESMLGLLIKNTRIKIFT